MKKRIQEMTLTPFANNENTPRYREHYGWLHIAYSAEIASQIEQDSPEFQLAYAWYANYQWMFGKNNAFLDDMIEKGVPYTKIGNREYLANYRTYIHKGTEWFGWGGEK